jgi:hypothetical protein
MSSLHDDEERLDQLDSPVTPTADDRRKWKSQYPVDAACRQRIEGWALFVATTLVVAAHAWSFVSRRPFFGDLAHPFAHPKVRSLHRLRFSKSGLFGSLRYNGLSHSHLHLARLRLLSVSD